MEPWDDEPTVIEVRDEELKGMPPLPVPLVRPRRARRFADEAWLAALPEPSRIVLERARRQAPSWPLAPRIEGAVALPVQRIPSLRPGASGRRDCSTAIVNKTS
ncbi:MAG: hypothetical protein NZ898_11480 [Myxococcota bacterium]|nr:hypothetical protein [Myxococcota bacterium]